MQDFETNSLWTHVTGECIMGDSENMQLTIFPSMHTTYGEYKRLYPKGLLLAKPEKGEIGSRYESYFEAEDKLGMFGRVDNFQRIKGKTIVFGVNLGTKQFAVSEKYLQEHGFAQYLSAGEQFIVTANASGTVAAFRLPGSVDLENATEVSDGQIKVTVGNEVTAWNARTGKCISGKGNDLEAVPVNSAFWFAWASFFPESDLIYEVDNLTPGKIEDLEIH